MKYIIAVDDRMIALDGVKEWYYDENSHCYVFYGNDDKALAVVPVREIKYVIKNEEAFLCKK